MIDRGSIDVSRTLILVHVHVHELNASWYMAACRRIKMTRLRQRVAERLKGAQNTYAMLSTFNEVDMTSLMEMRNLYKVYSKHPCPCQHNVKQRSSICMACYLQNYGVCTIFFIVALP